MTIPAGPPPVLVVGSFELPVSTLLTIAGVALAALMARARARRHGLPVRRTVDGMFLMVVVGLAAGHLTDVVLYRWQSLRADWRAILPASGGVCSVGAIAGATLAGFFWFRRAAGSLRAHADNIVLALCLGWAVGRVGCFLDHDHLGRLTTVPFAVLMPDGPRHDLGLYEAALALVIFAVLRALDRRRPPPGRIAALAAVLYGVGRFAIESLRADDIEALGRHSDPRWLGLTLAQYAAAALTAGAVAFVTRDVTEQRRARVPARTVR
jgi:phosphatidylglycerol:prolipoprotein diacylglycerol transferase